MEDYNYFLGSLSLALFLTMAFFSQVGLGVNLLLHSNTRDQESPNTPKKFNLWFLIRDNWKSIVLTESLILLTIRFAELIIPEQFKLEALLTPLGVDMWLLGAVLIGFFHNKLAQRWKDKTTWLKVERPENP